MLSNARISPLNTASSLPIARNRARACATPTPLIQVSAIWYSDLLDICKIKNQESRIKNQSDVLFKRLVEHFRRGQFTVDQVYYFNFCFRAEGIIFQSDDLLMKNVFHVLPFNPSHGADELVHAYKGDLVPYIYPCYHGIDAL